MSTPLSRRIGLTAAAVASLPLAGLPHSGASAAEVGHEPIVTHDFAAPGAHQAQLDGYHRIHIFGGAGGYSSGDDGAGGYVCWEGDFTGELDVFVGSHGHGQTGGASSIVRSSTDESAIIGIAGGGGGPGQANNQFAGGGAGGTQEAAADVDGESFAGENGQTDRNPLAASSRDYKGYGGDAGEGGARANDSASHATAGGDGVGGSGGGIYRANATPGSNGASWTGDGGGGHSTQKDDNTWRFAGAGGGGYGGGGGGGIERHNTFIGFVWSVGGGGGGGSYVGATPTPCSTETVQAGIDLHDRNGDGRVIIAIGTEYAPQEMHSPRASLRVDTSAASHLFSDGTLRTVEPIIWHGEGLTFEYTGSIDALTIEIDAAGMVSGSVDGAEHAVDRERGWEEIHRIDRVVGGHVDDASGEISIQLGFAGRGDYTVHTLILGPV